MLMLFIFGTCRWHSSSQRGDSGNEDWRRKNTRCCIACLFECIKWERSACCYCEWLSCPTWLWMGWSSSTIFRTAGWANPTYVTSFESCMLMLQLSYFSILENFNILIEIKFWNITMVDKQLPSCPIFPLKVYLYRLADSLCLYAYIIVICLLLWWCKLKYWGIALSASSGKWRLTCDLSEGKGLCKHR